MPRTMLKDQHWQNLKVILRNLSIHHNSNLLNFIEAILIVLIINSKYQRCLVNSKIFNSQF